MKNLLLKLMSFVKVKATNKNKWVAIICGVAYNSLERNTRIGK